MKKFPDFENIVDAVLSGDLLDKIGAFEPYESALSIASDMDALNQQPGARSLIEHHQRDRPTFIEDSGARPPQPGARILSPQDLEALLELEEEILRTIQSL